MNGKYNGKIKDLVLQAMFTAIIAVCSFVSLPIGSVPFTLQSLGAFCTAGFLGTKRGTISVACYLALGAMGLPIFSGFHGGVGVLLGATGGFLFGFLPVTAIVGFIAERFERTFRVLFGANILGTAVLHIFGVLWYWAVYNGGSGAGGLLSAFLAASAPFLLTDLLKAFLAALLTARLYKFVK